MPPPLTFEAIASREKTFKDQLETNPSTPKNSLKDFVDRYSEYIDPTTKQPVANQQRMQEILLSHVNETHPILDDSVIELIKNFLKSKLDYGDDSEKAFYKDFCEEKDPNFKTSPKISEIIVSAFITRLLTKRPIAFYDSSDAHVFLKNVTENEDRTKPTPDFISYPEMEISALLGLSSTSYFVNKGGYGNDGKKGNGDFINQEAIAIGQVGTRFEKQDHMEWKYMIITESQNTEANGYGTGASVNPNKSALLKPWADFYGVGHFPTYEEAKKIYEQETKNGGPPKTYIKEGNNYLHVNIYKARMKAVIKPFLIEANARAKEKGKKAYVHAAGLGLGVWALNKTMQVPLLLEVYADILKESEFSNINHIDFNYFSYGTNPKISPEDIKTKFDTLRQGSSVNNHITYGDSLTTPAAISDTKKDPNTIIAYQYAWDSNCLPGNEYYSGSLNASDDPRAACSTEITITQNHYINTENITGKKALEWLKAEKSTSTLSSSLPTTPPSPTLPPAELEVTPDKPSTGATDIPTKKTSAPATSVASSPPKKVAPKNPPKPETSKPKTSKPKTPAEQLAKIAKEITPTEIYTKSNLPENYWKTTYVTQLQSTLNPSSTKTPAPKKDGRIILGTVPSQGKSGETLNVVYQEIKQPSSKKQDKNTEIGRLILAPSGSSPDHKETTVATFTNRSIKLPLQPNTTNLIPIQSTASMDFLRSLKDLSDQKDMLTVKVKRFPKKDLEQLLNTLEQENPKIFVQLELQRREKTTYSETEYKIFSDRIKKYNQLLSEEPPTPKPPTTPLNPSFRTKP